MIASPFCGIVLIIFLNGSRLTGSTYLSNEVGPLALGYPRVFIGRAVALGLK
jgi:hypothetical protein